MFQRSLQLWQSSRQLRLIAMTFVAFTLWSSWGLYANYSHGLPTAMLAGLIQGLQSALSTFLGSAFIELLYSRLHQFKHAILVVTVTASTSSFSFMCAMHYLLGTPQILLTVAPVTVMATIYCWSYTTSLAKPLART